MATATVDLDGSSVELLVADRYGRVQERRLPTADREPTGARTDGAELRVARTATAAGESGVSRPPADSPAPRGEQADLPRVVRPRSRTTSQDPDGHALVTAAGGAQEPE